MPSTLNRRTRRSAFTLIELLLVLVILAVLATIVVVNFGSVFGSADKGKVEQDISNLDTAIELYRSHVKDLPKSLDDLMTNSTGSTDWKGPYLKKGVPKDPWGHDYMYVVPGQHNPNSYDLSSAGDGKKPPEGLDNWTVKK